MKEADKAPFACADYPVFVPGYLLGVWSRHSVFNFCLSSVLGSLCPAASGVRAEELNDSAPNGAQGKPPCSLLGLTLSHLPLPTA